MAEEYVKPDTMHKVKEASRRLGLEESTMRKKIFLREIPVFRVSKRAIRISEKTIQEILSKGYTPAL